MNDFISVEGLDFRYQSTDESRESPLALKNINLKIQKGEFVAVLGRNGSGKSTLAKLFNALLIPAEGKVTVEGLDTKDPENTWSIRNRCGMVFQNPENQIIATVVEEDVAFGAENLGVPSEEIRKRVDSALDTLGMREYAKKSPAYLSGGQKQRVAIAGILAMRPECIVLDEPTAMLDPVGRKDVENAILELNEKFGITIILITHFMDEAVRAKRVIVMDGGEIISDAPPEVIFSDVPGMKAVGLDVPQVTECAYGLELLGLPFPRGIIDIPGFASALEGIKSKNNTA